MAKVLRHVLLPLMALCMAHAQLPEYDHGVDIPTTQPLVVAHRGAAGIYPEHTSAAFQQAIQDGADFIECDLCLTRDLQIICMHESWMSSYTNVADVYPEDRMNTYFIVDDVTFRTDYFSVDFTLDELKLISQRQRYSYRDQSFDDVFPIISVNELIDMVQEANGTVGLYLEIKDPNWVNSLDIVTQANTTFEELVVDLVRSRGYDSPTSPCFIQSFNADSVFVVSTLTELPVVITRASGITISDEDLAFYSTFAYGINANKETVVRVGLDNKIVEVTDLVERVHSYNLRIHLWTTRNEYMHLAFDYHQDPALEYEMLLSTGADGIVGDFPGTNKRYLQSVYCDICVDRSKIL